MHRSVGEPGGTAGEGEVVQTKKSVSGKSNGGVSAEELIVSPRIIEISDKDYRSFCWPCNALEETGDGQPAE